MVPRRTVLGMGALAALPAIDMPAEVDPKAAQHTFDVWYNAGGGLILTQPVTANSCTIEGGVAVFRPAPGAAPTTFWRDFLYIHQHK